MTTPIEPIVPAEPLHLTAAGNPRGALERHAEQSHQTMLQALELRKAGATYDQISRQLDISKGSAHYFVHRAIAEITLEAAQEVRELELTRLDTALLAIWPQVRKGDLPSIDRFLRIQHQRALYLGLYSPIKVAPTNPTGDAEFAGKSDSDLVREFSGLIDAIRTRQASSHYVGDEAQGPDPEAGT